MGVFEGFGFKFVGSFLRMQPVAVPLPHLQSPFGRCFNSSGPVSLADWYIVYQYYIYLLLIPCLLTYLFIYVFIYLFIYLFICLFIVLSGLFKFCCFLESLSGF